MITSQCSPCAALPVFCPCPPSFLPSQLPMSTQLDCFVAFLLSLELWQFYGWLPRKKQKMGYRRYGLYLSRRRHESRIICFCCAPYGTMKPFFVPISVTTSAPCGPQTGPRRLHVSIAQPLRRLPVFRTRSTHVQGLANPSFKRSRVGGIFDMGDR